MAKDKIYLILIGTLLLISLIFGYKWFYGGNSASQERVKQLEAQFKELEEKKKASDEKIKYWETQFASLQAKSDSLKAEIDALEKQAQTAEADAKKSKAKFEALSKELAETRHKIEEFKKNPPNRTGDLLLESLKNKTK